MNSFDFDINEADRLTAHQKSDLAARHEKLNRLLSEKRQLEAEIGQLNERINSLRHRAQEVDYQFHKLAIETEPTIVGKPSGGPKQPKAPSVADKIARKLRERPELMENEELQKLLAGLI